MGMRGLISLDDCLRYSLIPPVMVYMFGDNIITLFVMNKNHNLHNIINKAYKYKFSKRKLCIGTNV